MYLNLHVVLALLQSVDNPRIFFIFFKKILLALSHFFTQLGFLGFIFTISYFGLLSCSPFYFLPPLPITLYL